MSSMEPTAQLHLPIPANPAVFRRYQVYKQYKSIYPKDFGWDISMIVHHLVILDADFKNQMNK